MKMSETQPAANICLTLLVGLPGSGKTTLAKFLEQCFSTEGVASRDSSLFNVIHICYDTLITADFSQHCSSDPCSHNWHDARKEVLTMVEKLMHLLKDIHSENEIYMLALKCEDGNKYINKDCEWQIVTKRKTLIVLDDNMYYSSMRHSYYQLAKRHNAGFCQFYLYCSVASALTFNSRRSVEDRIPCDVVRKMAARMEPPGSKPWEQYSVSLMTHVPYSNQGIIQEIKSTISEALLNPVQPIAVQPDLQENSRLTCMLSVVHQCDLELRHLVHEHMMFLKKSSNPDDLRVKSKALNAIRAELLNALREGKIIVPENLCVAMQKFHPLANVRLRRYLSTLLLL